MMQSNLEKRKRYWVLKICLINNEYGGLSVQELYSQQPKELSIDYGELDLILKELIGKKWIKPENKVGWSKKTYFYRTTNEGVRELRKVKILDTEFYKILELLPPDYLSRIRIINLEKFVLYATICSLLYINSIQLLPNHPLLSLLSLGLTLFFIPLGASYFIRIMLFHVVSLTENISKKTAIALTNKSGLISAISTMILVATAIVILWYQGSITVRWVGISAIIFGCILNGWIKNLLVWHGMLKNWLKGIGEKMSKDAE